MYILKNNKTRTKKKGERKKGRVLSRIRTTHLRLKATSPYHVEPRINEPLNNSRLYFLQPGQNYNKIYGTEPRFNEILVILNENHSEKKT